MEKQLYHYSATIVDVYDGDSVTALVDLGFSINFKIKVRLLGINTPEIRGEEREQGLISKYFVEDRVLDQEVVIVTKKDKKGKYGRWLGTIYYESKDRSWVNLNLELIGEGLAEPYK